MQVLSVLITLALSTGSAPPRDLPAVPVRAPAPACTDTVVNGVRVRSWSCLQEKLTPPEAQRAQVPVSEAERLMRQPGNQMLQYNLEGTRQRMGNALGNSVVPQRPAR
jgi:hypothetical protein